MQEGSVWWFLDLIQTWKKKEIMILKSISFIVLTKTVDILRIHIVYRTKEAGYCSYRCNGSIVSARGYILWFIYDMCRLLRWTLSFTKIFIYMVKVVITSDATAYHHRDTAIFAILYISNITYYGWDKWFAQGSQSS